VVKLEGRIAEILPALAARLEHAQSRRAAERS
jgi:hypothetical protein